MLSQHTIKEPSEGQNPAVTPAMTQPVVPTVMVTIHSPDDPRIAKLPLAYQANIYQQLAKRYYSQKLAAENDLRKYLHNHLESLKNAPSADQRLQEELQRCQSAADQRLQEALLKCQNDLEIKHQADLLQRHKDEKKKRQRALRKLQKSADEKLKAELKKCQLEAAKNLEDKLLNCQNAADKKLQTVQAEHQTALAANTIMWRSKLTANKFLSQILKVRDQSRLDIFIRAAIDEINPITEISNQDVQQINSLNSKMTKTELIEDVNESLSDQQIQENIQLANQRITAEIKRVRLINFLRKRIYEQSKLITSLENEINNIKKNQDQRARLSSLKADLEVLKKEIADKSIIIKDQKETISDLASELVTSENTKIEDLLKELAGLKAQTETTNKTVGELRAELASANTDNTKLADENQAYALLIQNKQREIDTLASAVAHETIDLDNEPRETTSRKRSRSIFYSSTSDLPHDASPRINLHSSMATSLTHTPPFYKRSRSPSALFHPASTNMTKTDVDIPPIDLNDTAGDDHDDLYKVMNI